MVTSGVGVAMIVSGVTGTPEAGMPTCDGNFAMQEARRLFTEAGSTRATEPRIVSFRKIRTDRRTLTETSCFAQVVLSDGTTHDAAYTFTEAGGRRYNELFTLLDATVVSPR